MAKKRNSRMGSKDIAKQYTADKKARRAGKNVKRQKPEVGDVAGAQFLKRQALDRWPSDDTIQKLADLNEADRKRTNNRGRRPAKKAMPPLPMPMLESLAFHSNPKCADAVAKLLLAACLKVKRVKRHPGWVLQRTYSLKNRPIDLSV